MGNLQKYASFDLDTLDEEEAELNKSSRPSEFMKMEDGNSYKLRFLPPPVDAAWAKTSSGKSTPFKIIHEHFIEVPGKEYKAHFVCPRLHADASCPACDTADELYRSGNALDRKKANDYRSNPRVYCNVIDRDNEDKGPIIYAFGKGVKKDLGKIAKKCGSFVDPTENGYDIWIDRENENGRISYTVTADRDSTPLGDEDWLDSQYDLNAYVNVPTLDEILDQLGEGDGGGRRRRGNSTSRKQISSGRSSEKRAPKRTAGTDMAATIDAEIVDEEIPF